jgi:hypothetical protein
MQEPAEQLEIEGEGGRESMACVQALMQEPAEQRTAKQTLMFRFFSQ